MMAAGGRRGAGESRVDGEGIGWFGGDARDGGRGLGRGRGGGGRSAALVS